MLDPWAAFKSLLSILCCVLCAIICTIFLTWIITINNAAVVVVSFLNSPWDPTSLACFPSEF